MLAAGKWVTSIVVGGITLGALLGAAADPRVKDPPKQWWQLTGRDTIAAVGDQLWFESGPDDLSPFGAFRPDLDYDAEIWALPIPAAEMATYSPPYDPFEEAGGEPEPTVAAAADEAEMASEEAVEAAAADVAAAEVRKPELAADGIY